MPAHFAATPRGGNTLGLLAPDPRQEPTAPAPVAVKSESKACLRRLSPARRRERRGRAPLPSLAEAWGRYMRIKAPWLRRYAAAGRAKALTRTPLERLTTELIRSQKSKSKAAQKGRK